MARLALFILLAVAELCIAAAREACAHRPQQPSDGESCNAPVQLETSVDARYSLEDVGTEQQILLQTRRDYRAKAASVAQTLERMADFGKLSHMEQEKRIHAERERALQDLRELQELQEVEEQVEASNAAESYQERMRADVQRLEEQQMAKYEAARLARDDVLKMDDLQAQATPSQAQATPSQAQRAPPAKWPKPAKHDIKPGAKGQSDAGVSRRGGAGLKQALLDVGQALFQAGQSLAYIAEKVEMESADASIAEEVEAPAEKAVLQDIGQGMNEARRQSVQKWAMQWDRAEAHQKPQSENIGD